MKYSRTLVAFLTLYVIALVAMAFGAGLNPNVNAWSIALLVSWVVAVQFALLTAARGTAGRFILWLATYLTIFFWIPFFGYLLLPSAFPKWRLSLHDDATTVNVALGFMLAGTIVIVVGYVAGAIASRRIGQSLDRRYAGRPRRQRWLYLSPTWFFVCAMVFLALEAYVTLRFATYFVGNAASGEGSWWRRLSSFSLFSLVGLVYLLDRWPRLTRRGQMLIAVPIALSYLLHVLTGSRSAIFYAGLFVLQYFLVKEGDFKMGRRLFAGLAGAALVAALVFPVASEARFFWSNAFTAGFETEEAKASLWESVSKWQDPVTYLAPFLRLDLFGVVLLIVDGPESPLIDPAPHLGPVHDFKAFVNIIMPGEPFPGVLESSLTFNLIYLGIPAYYFSEFNRVTTSWTMWGLAYAWAGFAGGLILLFFWAAACTFLYRLLIAWSTGPFSIYFAVWAFTKLATQLDTFGFDMSMAYVVYDLMAFVPAALLLWFGTRLRPIAGGLPTTIVPSELRPPAGSALVPNPARQ